MIIDIRIWIAGLLADLAEWILPQLNVHKPKDPDYWKISLDDLNNDDEEEIEW